MQVPKFFENITQKYQSAPICTHQNFSIEPRQVAFTEGNLSLYHTWAEPPGSTYFVSKRTARMFLVKFCGTGCDSAIILTQIDTFSRGDRPDDLFITFIDFCYELDSI